MYDLARQWRSHFTDFHHGLLEIRSPSRQITLAQSQERSAVLLKGQSHTQAFATAGVYEYTCGRHPNMKGAVEVK